MEKVLQGNKIVLGTCYYPEHWDEKMWKEDLLRMKQNGIFAVRIAEFAWSKTEPTEGNFIFDFFDRFLELAKETDMSVIFCTPTATPPAWLTLAYPEVLNARIDGTLLRHGARRHYNYNSPVYRRFSSRIVEKLASHYGKHPNIIGWEIDGELNCETDVFYSESDTVAFREFLKNKYTTLDALNDAWGAVFWNQTYTAWGEVFVPRPTIHDTVNPHEIFDYIRFISDSTCSFAKMQGDILRKYIKPGDFLTHNGIFTNLDNHRLTAESLNVMFYDCYPNFAYCLDADPLNSRDLNDRKWSRNLSEVRSISGTGIFGIMEQQSGPHGWNNRMEAAAPRPGQMTLWTLQSIAHGADYISFFRWRTCTKGTEIYWHGILDYSNRDNRRLTELSDIYRKTTAIKAVAGSRFKASFGVLKDYDNIWDAELDTWHSRVNDVSEAGIFQASQLTHTPMDYVYIPDSENSAGKASLKTLQKYPVLFYPHPVIVTQETAALLEQYVKAGGTLVLGCRTGYKDSRGQCPMVKLPGLLRGISGTDVIDYTFIAPDDSTVTVDWDGEEIEAAVFIDVLEPLENGKVLGKFKQNYYEGRAGLICNEYGKGRVYYFGGAFTRETAMVFLKKLGIAEPYRDIIDTPDSCELVLRESNGEKYLFVLNYSKQGTVITLKKELQDLYSGKAVSGRVELPPYGTAVYGM
ncbi:MAG: beta-galactosidase [Treponema sp.]|jgi:beta-galactosidase|nr:beta-galactosidase [Treponema sp.]